MRSMNLTLHASLVAGLKPAALQAFRADEQMLHVWQTKKGFDHR